MRALIIKKTMWHIKSPTNSNKLLIKNKRSFELEYNGERKTTKISLAMEIRLQKKCYTA